MAVTKEASTVPSVELVSSHMAVFLMPIKLPCSVNVVAGLLQLDPSKTPVAPKSDSPCKCTVTSKKDEAAPPMKVMTCMGPSLIADPCMAACEQIGGMRKGRAHTVCVMHICTHMC